MSRDDPATKGDLEDLATGFRDFFHKIAGAGGGGAGDDGGGDGGPPPPQRKPDDNEGQGDGGNPWSVAEWWFGSKAK